MSRRLLITLLTFGVLLVCSAGSAQAATCNDYWIHAGSGDWSDGGNWSDGVPTSSSNVCLDNSHVSGSYTVDIDTYNPSLVANSISINGSSSNVITLAILGTGGGVDVCNTLTLSDQDDGAGVGVNGAITLGSTAGSGVCGRLVEDAGTLDNAGTITSEPDNGVPNLISGSFDNTGTLAVDEFLDGGLDTWTDSGTITVASGQTLELETNDDVATEGFTQTGGTITNNGTMTESNGGYFDATGNGTLTGNAPQLTVDGIGLSGSGSGTFQSLGGTETMMTSNLGAGYTLNVTGAPGYTTGDLTLTGAYTNFGTITLGTTEGGGDSATINAPNGTFTNAGTIISEPQGGNGLAGAIDNTGTITVTSSLNVAPTTFTTSGTITVASGQTLYFDAGTGTEVVTQTAGTITNNGTFQDQEGTFNAAGGTDTGAPLILNGGTLNAAGGGTGSFQIAACNETLGSNVSAGYTIAAGGEGGYCNGTLTVNSSITLAGTISLGNQASGTLDYFNITSGTVTNTGTVDFIYTGGDGIDGPYVNDGTTAVLANGLQGTGVITNNGTFTVTDGAQVNATSYTQSSGGTTGLAITGGSSPAVPEFMLTGAASLAGTLAVNTTGGTATGTFPIFADASQTGSFAANDDTGEYYTPTYSATGVTLTGPESAPSGGGGGGGGGSSPKPGTPKVTKVSSKDGKLIVTVSCPAGSSGCATAKFVAHVTEHLKGKKLLAVSAAAKKGKKAKKTTKTVLIASGSVTLAAGASKTLTISLNGAGHKLLERFKKLKADYTVTASGVKIKSGTVTITLPKKKKAKKHKKK